LIIPNVKENLFEYINASNPEYEDILECLEYEIHNRVYYYGAHFKNERESKGFLRRIRFFYKHLRLFFYILMSKNNLEKNFNGIRVLSATTVNYDEMLESEKLHVDRVPLFGRLGRPLNISFKVYIAFLKVDYRVNFYSFYDLVSSENVVFIRNFKKVFCDFIKLNNYQLLLVPEDLNFWHRLSIQAFKGLGIPSVCMAHGGTSMLYEGVADSKVSHLTVWGALQAQFHIENNYNPKKISITGHPKYLFEHKKLKFSLDNILVIAKSMAGVVLSKKKFIEDRGNSIMYLLMIEKALKDLGIVSVSFRPHPSESYAWYSKFIDSKFFNEDKEVLSTSLQASTLVIGPKSTAMVDAIAHGVNYVIFEPSLDGSDVFSGVITPPFDGSDPDFPVAANSLDLINILQNKLGINISAFERISKSPFDASFIRKFLDDN